MVGPPTPLTVDERIGVAFIVEAAALSMLAPLALLLQLLYTALRDALAPLDRRAPQRSWFLRSHLNLYFTSLLFSDTIQGLGGFMDLKWVSSGFVSEGPYCTAQGALKQVGDVGVALSVLAITVHTFFVIFYHWIPPDSPALPIGMLATSWLFITLLVSLGYTLHRHAHYYGITGLWCWITAAYPKERIALEYAWLWTTALLNVLLYIPLFFALRGNIVTHGWRVSFRGAGPRKWDRQTDREFHTRLARTMLIYPIVYLITILPTTVTRFLSFSGFQVPFQATIFTGLLFSSSGVANVVLFTRTRPTLLPPGLRSDDGAPEFSPTNTDYRTRSGAGTATRDAGIELKIVSPTTARGSGLYSHSAKAPWDADAGSTDGVELSQRVKFAPDSASDVDSGV